MPTQEEAETARTGMGARAVLLVGILPPPLLDAVLNARVLAWNVRTVEAAIVTLQRERFDVVLVDERSLDGLTRLRKAAPYARYVLVCTTAATPSAARVDAVLPWPSSDEAVALAIDGRSRLDDLP